MKKAAMWAMAILFAGLAQAQTPVPAPGTVVPVTMTNIAPTQGSLAQALLSKFPLPPNGVIGGVLQQFSWTLTVNGTPYVCLFGNADATGAINLSCVVPGAAAAPLPPSTSASASATVTRVHQGVCGDLLIGGAISEQATCSATWTVSAGNFLVAMVASSSSTTLTGMTANTPVGASYPMQQAVAFTTGKQPVYLFYLANAPGGIASFTASYTQSNEGPLAAIAVAEYSGLAKTASVVATPITASSAYASTQSWNTGNYTVPSGALVIAGAASNFGAGTWTPASGWTSVAAYGGAGTVPAKYSGYTSPEIELLEQIAPPAGNYSGAGSYAPGYQIFDSFIVAFK